MNWKNRLVAGFAIFIVSNLVAFFLFGEDTSLKPLTRDEQKEFLSKVGKELAQITSIKTSFTQERNMELFLDTIVSKGVCYFQKPDKLRWEIKESYKSILVFNGNKVSKFDFEKNKLSKLRIGNEDLISSVLKEVINWMQGDFNQSSDMYEISVFSKGALYIVKLVPVSKTLLEYVNAIELEVNLKAKKVMSVLIRESASDFTRIIFSDDIQNSILDPALFDLNNPQM